MRRWTVLFLVVALAATACSGSDSSSKSASSTPGAALAAGELALPAATPWPNGSWAGKVEGTDAFIAVVAGAEGLVAYVCDNGTIGQWFRTDDANGSVVVANEAGAVFSAERSGEQVTGSVQLPDGTEHPFSAATASEPVHRSEGFDDTEVGLVGWVTLPSGERRGTALVVPKTTTAKITPTTTASTTTATTVGVPATVPLATKVTTAPDLKLGTPVVVAKTLPGTIDKLDLPPANPLTPDAVNPPTPNDLKFVWAALGDSYAAGEGAPVTAGRFGRPFFNVETPTDWGRAVPDSGVTAEERRSCHRSEKAGAPVANERLKRAFPELSIDFIHLACSGAETFDIMHPMPDETNIQGYDGPDLTAHVEQPAQGQRAAEWAADKGAYDALYMSIGGNDVGFGDVITECLLSNDEGNECSDKALSRGADPRMGRPAISVQDAINRLPQSYRDLDTYLRSTSRPARPATILLSKSPDPTKGDNGVDCGDGNGHLKDDILSLISKEEMVWARREILDKGINQNVEGTGKPTAQGGLGWTVIDQHLAAFENHGLCATDNFINTNNDALETQGDDYDASTPLGTPLRPTLIAAAAALTALAATAAGAVILAPVLAVAAALVAAGLVHLAAGLVHPNAKGFEKYADAIEAKISPLIEAKMNAGLRPPARVRQVSAVNNGEIVLRWDDKSKSEDRYEINVTRLDGTAATPAPLRVGKNIQEVRVPLNGRFAGRFEVRACVRLTCSDPGVVEAANFVPATPTDGSGSYTLTRVDRLPNSNRAIAIVGWLGSRFAQRYVIDYRQVDPAGATNGTQTPATPFGAIAIKEPPHTTTGNDKALYAFKISACSRVGCSPFSPEVQVDTRGPAPAVKVIQPDALKVGFERPELVVEGGNKIGPNPLPLAPSRDLTQGDPNATIPDPNRVGG